MFVPRPEPDAPPSESVFVHGNNPTATSTMAAGLAMRRHVTFSWADCAVAAEDRSAASPALLTQGRSRTGGREIGTSDASVPPWTADAVERVLVPENRMDSLRLMSYLALPSLLQELAAMSTSPTGESFVILTNIDALDPRLRGALFGREDVHRRLRETKVSLYVTAKQRPTAVEETLFDRILRVDVEGDAIWSDGTVRLEKVAGQPGGARPMSLRQAWETLRLDPTLLPPD
jgi:hypothetical protein